MYKKILLLPLFLLSFLVIFSGHTFAVDRPHFVTFTNPVRGEEGGVSETQGPLDLPRYQYQLAKENKFPVDWLLRYDALVSATISGYFKTIVATDSSQTVGAFLEITPQFAIASGVIYPEGEYMSQANRIFLSGYSQSDRLKLIDTYMKLFYETYGQYPKVVGAWHIDAFSLKYLADHYSVVSAVICDEQYNTDSYRLWGGYLGSPYFPSKYNFLIPATTSENRINIVLTKWAQRDPFNFYGNRIESNYSVQVNDYSFFGLSTKFFSDLISIYSNGNFNEFTQTNIGLENDYNLAQYKAEIKNSYQMLRAIESKNNLKFVSSEQFAKFMDTRYSFTNPAFYYETTDITSKLDGRVSWYQNPFYRIGIRSTANGKSQIIDFRIYNQNEAEGYYLTKNVTRTLYSEVPALIDSIKYPGTAVDLDLDLNNIKPTFDHWKIIWREGDKEFKLEPNRLSFTNISTPNIESDQFKSIKKGNTVYWELRPVLPFSGNNIVLGIILLAIGSIAAILIIKSPKNKLPLSIGMIMGLVALATVFRSGTVYLYGLGLWGPNGHDAIFHLSLASHFKNAILSLNHPQLNGELLKNYHFGFDWITGLISKITTISLLDLYFRIVPLIIVITLVIFVVKLLTIWRYSTFEKIIGVSLMFVCGSAGFIANMFMHRSILGGESTFWANQSISILLNPPFALSILGLVVLMIFLEKHPHRLSTKELLLVSLLGGALVQIKIYAFLLFVAALFFQKKFKLMISTSIVGLLFILPSLGLNGTPFSLNPLWFTRSMFEAPDRLYWPQLAGAWQVYENNGVFTKLVMVNLFAILVFYAGNLYIRLLGLNKVIFERGNSISQSLIRTIIIVGLIIPLVITQKVNPWNTIQFMYYSLFFLSFFTAKQIGEWFTKIKNPFVFAISYVLIILVSFPTTIGTLSDYLTSHSASRISLTELHALDKLKNSTPGVVVTPLTYNRYQPLLPDPRPLYVYASTAYVSALSGHPEYLSDTINLDITGFNYQDRVKNVIRLYQTRDPEWVKSFLESNNIKYVYETPNDRLMIEREKACLEKIFDSGEINLYKYDCHVQK